MECCRLPHVAAPFHMEVLLPELVGLEMAGAAEGQDDGLEAALGSHLVTIGNEWNRGLSHLHVNL